MYSTFAITPVSQLIFNFIIIFYLVLGHPFCITFIQLANKITIAIPSKWYLLRLIETTVGKVTFLSIIFTIYYINTIFWRFPFFLNSKMIPSCSNNKEYKSCLQRSKAGWREVMVDIDPEVEDKLRFVVSRAPTPASALLTRVKVNIFHTSQFKYKVL